MKKIVVVFGAIIFAATLFLNSNSIIGAEKFDLDNLISLNSADAECTWKGYSLDYGCEFGECVFWGNGPFCDPVWW